MNPLALSLAEVVAANRFEGSRQEACASIAEDVADVLELRGEERSRFLDLCGLSRTERRDEVDSLTGHQERCSHGESLYGRCAFCGLPWARQA